MTPIVALSPLRNDLEEFTTDPSWCPLVSERSDLPLPALVVIQDNEVEAQR